MNRRMTLSVLSVCALGLAACNRSEMACNPVEADQPIATSFGPDEGVWYNANGERVHRWQLQQMEGDWYCAKMARLDRGDSSDYYASQPSDNNASPSSSDEPCTCPEKKRMKKKEESGQ